MFKDALIAINEVHRRAQKLLLIEGIPGNWQRLILAVLNL